VRCPLKPLRSTVDLQVVKLGHTNRGFVLLPRRWVIERSLSWRARHKRLARDYERLAVSLHNSTTWLLLDSCLPKPPALNLLKGA
jgi:transposase